jgi:hypothetical protein
MKYLPVSIALLASLNAVAPARADQIQDGKTSLTINKDGGGFIDAIAFSTRTIAQSKAGLAGAVITLATAGDGSVASLFTPRATAELVARVDSLSAANNAITLKGQYVSGQLHVPFTRTVALQPGKDALHITEETDFTALPQGYVVAEHRLDLPLVVDKDPHLRMYAFGGEKRVEMFRMDQNDVRRTRIQLISSARGHWPYWDRAGMLQLPGSYTVWKANHADTMAYPIEQGNGAPGWADYSELEWGVTATMADPAKSAPWEMTIDARNGMFSFNLYPASQPPASPTVLGRRTMQFDLLLHEKSWPATYPCELDFGLYAAWLESLGYRGNYPYTVVVGTPDIPTVIFRERVQPSVILRSLYAGDAWRMSGMMQSIGKSSPRNQPMEKWEADARMYLEYLQKNGLPKKKEVKK